MSSGAGGQTGIRTQEEAFLRAIRDEPEDDGLRLIFADWLEERNDLRGTLIRVQVTRARLPASHPLYAELELAEKQLLEQQGAGFWLGSFLWRIRRWRFQRGLLHIEADGSTFLDDPLPSGAVAWVERLGLWQVSVEQINRLEECSQFAALSMLDLPYNRLGSRGATALAQLPSLERLRWLDLSGNGVGDAGAVALARSPWLTRLTALHLSGNQIGPGGARGLAASTTLASLTTLDLSYNHLGNRGATALAGSLHLNALESLFLSGNDIRSSGARALAASPHLPRLRVLHLSGNHLNKVDADLLHGRFGNGVRC
jgi:uncharacterized protein (TIGR02996 family)